MQQSWRRDHDKLTFIICLPLHASSAAGVRLDSTVDDAPDAMLGDVNVFFTPSDDNAQSLLGELEIMIARPDQRRRGHGRAAILVLMRYICAHLDAILNEYRRGCFVSSETPLTLSHFRVKIGQGNDRSLRLFESLGFVRTTSEANYFGEYELRLDLATARALVDKLSDISYAEMEYI